MLRKLAKRSVVGTPKNQIAIAQSDGGPKTTKDGQLDGAYFHGDAMPPCRKTAERKSTPTNTRRSKWDKGAFGNPEMILETFGRLRQSL